MAEIPSEFINAASALAPLLGVFDGLAGRSLAGAWLRREHGLVSETVLDFGGVFFAAVADEDFDTLRLELRAAQALSGFVAADTGDPWRGHLGQRFSWGCMNEQGYIDGALLGFGDDIYPKLILYVIASVIIAGAIAFTDPGQHQRRGGPRFPTRPQAR